MSEETIEPPTDSILNSLDQERRAPAIRNDIDPVHTKVRDGTWIGLVKRILQVRSWQLGSKSVRRVPERVGIEWCGEGGEWSLLGKTLREAGLGDWFELKGMAAQGAMLDYVPGSEYYLSTSQAEELGGANIEACALGRILLVSSLPAHEEVGATIGFELLAPYDPGARIDRSWAGFGDEQPSCWRNHLIRKLRASYDPRRSVARHLEVCEELAVGVDRGEAA